MGAVMGMGGGQLNAMQHLVNLGLLFSRRFTVPPQSHHPGAPSRHPITKGVIRRGLIGYWPGPAPPVQPSCSSRRVGASLRRLAC